MSTREELKERIKANLAALKARRRLLALGWSDDPDEWYAREVERMRERAPA